MGATRSQPSRRDAIAGGIAAFAASAFPHGSPASALQIGRDLIDLLVVQEQIQIAHYTAILQVFDDAAFAAAAFPAGVRSGIDQILAAEHAHLATLTDPDQPRASAPPPNLTNLVDALREAAELENLAVASYAFVIPELGRQRLIPLLVGIHSVEARHAAWLATLLGDEPFPDAIDPALTPEEPPDELTGPAASPAGADGSVADADLAPVVAAIGQELGVSSDAIGVVSVTPQDWPDSSLGCPQPDMVYAQVITPGYLVIVDVSGERIEFHTDERGNIVRCP